MKNKKGFTMVELLVVLIIIGILAAVATPLYLANTQKARASEAVATMGLIRQALRDYRVNTNTYFDVAVNATDGNIQNSLPASVNTTTGVATPATSGLDINVGTAQYFSNHAFSVDAINQTSSRFTAPGPVDFVISTNGSNSAACSGSVTNCAVKAGEINNFDLEMDNSGRIYISYDNGSNWEPYN